MDWDDLTDEILARCDALARFSESPDRLTRTYLSPPVADVHACLMAWMREAGLSVRRDAVGNLIGRRAGRRPDARVFVVGSHIDTVPNAGRYDGPLGVLLGIAAAKRLAGRAFPLALDIIAFSEEEGIRFRTPYLGSLAVAGQFAHELLNLTDADGITLERALRAFGLDPGAVPAAAYPAGSIAGYLEAHIEQGPVLEALGKPLGIVEAIVGQSRCWVRFGGQAGHAGAQPMGHRHDALAAAAELICHVETRATATPGLCATVGCIAVEPGAVNVVPGDARLSLDVRHADDGVRQRLADELQDQARIIAGKRGLTHSAEWTMKQNAVPMNAALTERLSAAAKDYQPHPMPSGAGHDAAVMASIAPTAMLFLRSPGGISHHPDEAVCREDVRAALDVMLRFLTTELSIGPP